MQESFYIPKRCEEEIGLFGDTICIISKLLQNNSTVNLYSESKSVRNGWPNRWHEFLELAVNGEKVKLKTETEIPEEALEVSSELSVLGDGSSPYFKINWDLVNSKAKPLLDDYSGHISWSRRPRRLEYLPPFIIEKYKDYNFINLADDRGRNVHGKQRKYDIYTCIWIMNKSHRYIGIDSGGIHLAGCVLPPSKISVIPDPSMYRFDKLPNWQGLFYDKLGYEVELPVLDQDTHYRFLQR